MAAKKKGDKGKPGKQVPGGESAPSKESKVVTKIEAVSRALAELGKDATPLAIQTFLKERFAVEIALQHISMVIAQQKQANGRDE